MTDAEYWKKEAQAHADAIQEDVLEPDQERDLEEREDTSRAPFGAYSVPTYPRVAVLYGKGPTPFKDDEVAREAVKLLRERFYGLGVRELTDAVDSEDGLTWTIIVQSPARLIEANIDQLSDEVERAYRIAREQE